MPRLLRDVNSPSPDRGFPELGPAMEAMHLQQYGLQDSDAPRTPGGSRIEHDREYSNSSQHGSSGSAETNPETPPFGWSFNVPRLAPMPPPQGDDLHFLSSLSA